MREMGVRGVLIYCADYRCIGEARGADKEDQATIGATIMNVR